ncbi:MAG: type restriction enzyme protein, partial [Cyanobacteriota bacterium]
LDLDLSLSERILAKTVLNKKLVALEKQVKASRILNIAKEALTEKDIRRITDTFLEFEETAESKIFDNDDFGYHKIVVERPLRLAFQVTVERVERFNLTAAVGLRPIVDLLQSQFGDKRHLDWNQVRDRFEKALKKQEIKLKATDWKAIRDGFTERDEAAEPVILKKTKDAVVYEPDAELRDTENVPLKEEIADYVEREVLPHVPDAWVDEEKTQRGYEISFTKYFYKFKPLRSLEAIAADILALEKETDGVLKQIISG